MALRKRKGILVMPNLHRRTVAYTLKGGKKVIPGFPAAKGGVPEPPP